MENKKVFMKGCIAGIIFFLLINFLGTSVIGVYRRVVSKNLTYEQKINEIKKIVSTYSVNEFDKNYMQEGMYKGAVASLQDPYSYYMTKNEFKDFLQDTNGNYVGIGILVKVSEDGKILLSKVFKGSPAQDASLLEGDKIIKVEDVEVNFNNYQDVVDNIKGKQGTNVKLTVYRESQDKTFEVNVLRKSIDVPTVEHKVLDDNIGYISISQFDRVTLQQFKDAFNALEEQNTKGLIIDLRNNPGGLLTTVCEITDMLVPEGTITYIEDKNGKKEYQYSDEKYYNKPLVILVNENSASASEVLAGAVKDYGVGKLVGNKTFGKGVVQNIYTISDGSGIKVTIAKYYTPNGICIDGEGIEPDFNIDLDKDSSEDAQLLKSIEVINNW